MATPTRTAASTEPACGLLILTVARASGRRLADALAGLGMRGHEFAVLHYLSDSPPVSQQQLGEALRIHPSNLVGLLDALEADGLVVRPRDPADRRRHLVELTDRGQRRLDAAKRAAIGAERDLLEPLSSRERDQLYAYLSRLADHSCGTKACGPRSF
jgi:MarR family transcriptional regulator, lower aerobic nicotinate degradation pathway regulator